MKLDQKNIELIKAYLQDKPVNRAYLFGSFVRGEAGPDSDVDILVELDYRNPIGLLFIRMEQDLARILNRKVDLVSAQGMSKYLKPVIDQEKQLIYAR
ncbi:MAG: nucleotidyltransferase domain-containing protein [Phaeodactylibacter sp.]|nr:nucleotidyltransferase domain-containing protein [Phaeodactylibacter sp.]